MSVFFCVCVCASVCVCDGETAALHTSVSGHLASGLSRCLSPCLASHASFTLSVSLSVGMCMCVSMGEMTTELPAVLTTRSAPFSYNPLFLLHLASPL